MVISLTHPAGTGVPSGVLNTFLILEIRSVNVLEDLNYIHPISPLPIRTACHGLNRSLKLWQSLKLNVTLAGIISTRSSIY